MEKTQVSVTQCVPTALQGHEQLGHRVSQEGLPGGRALPSKLSPPWVRASVGLTAGSRDVPDSYPAPTLLLSLEGSCGPAAQLSGSFHRDPAAEGLESPAWPPVPLPPGRVWKLGSTRFLFHSVQTAV